jgi:hypothetical protein
LSPIAILLGVLAALQVNAVEKHWIAHEAQSIVVGTFSPWPTFPWFDGWHMNGVIRVDEILYGNPVPREIQFRFVCRWDDLCQRWPPPRYPKICMERGLWFLRRVDGDAWGPSVGSGFQLLSDRSYWENYIRLYKGRPAPAP